MLLWGVTPGRAHTHTFSSVWSFCAEHTIPYAPFPMGLTGLYLASTSNMFPHTCKAKGPLSGDRGRPERQRRRHEM